MKRRDLIKTLAGIALATGVPSVFATKTKHADHFEGEAIYGSKGVRLVNDPEEFGYKDIKVTYLSHEEAENAGYSMVVDCEGRSLEEIEVAMNDLYSFLKEDWTCADSDVVRAIRNGGW